MSTDEGVGRGPGHAFRQNHRSARSDQSEFGRSWNSLAEFCDVFYALLSTPLFRVFRARVRRPRATFLCAHGKALLNGTLSGTSSLLSSGCAGITKAIPTSQTRVTLAVRRKRCLLGPRVRFAPTTRRCTVSGMTGMLADHRSPTIRTNTN
jgi:hypothetical protein